MNARIPRIAAMVVVALIGWIPSPARGAGLVIAYQNEPGVFGQQILGPLVIGNDFDVVAPVQVVSLGAFDSGTDGIFNQPVAIGIFDRDTESLVTPSLTFSTEDPGVAVGGSRFKPLETPVVLPAGFHGSIVGFNYGGHSSGLEPNGNTGFQPRQWSFNDGGGRLTGLDGRWDFATGLVYPTSLMGGAYDMPVFAAGTFGYEAAIPEPSLWALATGWVLVGYAGARRHRWSLSRGRYPCRPSKNTPVRRVRAHGLQDTHLKSRNGRPGPLTRRVLKRASRESASPERDSASAPGTATDPEPPGHRSST